MPVSIVCHLNGIAYAHVSDFCAGVVRKNLKCSGGGALGQIQFVVEKSASMAYNILNKEADTIADTYPFPAKVLDKK